MFNDEEKPDLRKTDRSPPRQPGKSKVTKSGSHFSPARRISFHNYISKFTDMLIVLFAESCLRDAENLFRMIENVLNILKKPLL